MARKWGAIFLALMLCVQQAVPVAATEEASGVPQAAGIMGITDEQAGDMLLPEDIDMDVDPEAEAYTGTNIDVNADIDVDTDTYTDANTGTDTDACTDAEIDTDMDAGANSDLPMTSEFADGAGLPETVKIAENELMIDLSETLGMEDGLSRDAEGQWGTTSGVSGTDDPWDAAPDASDPWGVMPAEDGAQTETALDAENFPDELFRTYLGKFDIDGSGGLSAEEIAKVTEIDVIGKGVADLTGLEYFTALTGLYCDNNDLTALDVSKNTKLGCLTCADNRLGSLSLNSNKALFSLVCTDNQLKELNLANNTRLQDLRCAGNELQALDISKNMSLMWLDCSRNNLTDLDASGHTKLQYLFCGENRLASLNVSGATKLQWLECQQNRLTDLDISGVLNVNASQDSAMNLLNCAENQLMSLVVGDKEYFKGLVCSGNAIEKLDLTAAPDLRQLECADNALKTLDLTRNTKLQTLDCSGNQLTSLDLSKLSITETTVLPNCSGQKFSLVPEKTENGIQVDLKKLFGNVEINIVRMTKEEFEASSCTEKSAWGNAILIAQEEDSLEGELEDGVLTFSNGQLPETIELFCATGYRKKAGEKDVLLGLVLSHTHPCTQTETKDPSCTEKGYVRKTCAECGFDIVTILPAAGHDYQRDDGVSKEPTCTESGYLKESCTVCGDTITIEELPPTGHSNELIRIMATCTEDGSEYQQCSVCGYIDPESKKTLSAKGHRYEQIDEQMPDCTTEGFLKEKCQRCGFEITTVLPKKEHAYQEMRVAPTCLKEGRVWEQCKICGAEKDGSSQTLSKLSHLYGEYTVVREATIFEAGEKRRTCAVCGDVQSAPIAKLDGTVGLTAGNMPIQIKEKVSVQSLVTGLQEDDYVTSWSSGNSDIASVSEDGTIVAKKTGAVDITVATKSGATAVMTVKVQKDKVVTKGITGLKNNVSVAAGEKLKLTPVLTPISSQQKITYQTSNKKIATVSAKGVVKGVKKGTAKITVKSGSKKFVVKVKVTAPAVKKIKNIPAKKTLRKGKSYQLKPRLTPAGCSQKVTYKSSDKKVVTVTSKGKLTAKKKGTATITVTAGSKKVVCKVVVTG